MKAHTVVKRGEKSLLGDPGSEFQLGREKKKKTAQIIEEMNKNIITVKQ